MSRFDPWGFVALVLLVAAAPAAGAPRAYVSDGTGDRIVVVDTATGAVGPAILVGNTPLGVAVNAAGTRAYVSNFDDGTVSVVDTATNTVVATVPVLSLPLGVAVHPDGSLVYVANLSSSILSVIDAATNVPAGIVPVGNSPTGVAILPSGSAGYAANSLDGTVSVFDPATGAVFATIPVGSQPSGVAVAPDGSRVYVSNNGSGSVTVIDALTNTTVTTIAVGSLPSGVAAGAHVFVANGNATVSAIDPATNTVVATIPVGNGTPASATYFGLALRPDGRRLYVTNSAIGTLSVVDTGTSTVVATIPVGGQPLGFGAFVGPCAAAADCDDANPCTDDACDVATGRCTHAANTDPCDDNDACTPNDTCAAGACVGDPAPSCDDTNPCTDDACNPASGLCTHQAITGGCEDGNACTVGDTCTAGVCIAGAAPSCDDANACTDDTCNPASGCVHTNRSGSCDDGNACTTGDACQSGVCVGGAGPSCDDGNPCTTDTCSPGTGCVHTNAPGPCSDGNACTTSDACVAGACVGGAAPDCDDANPCTDDACVPATGCVHQPHSGTCDDDNACTTNDACQAGVCAGGPALDCADGNPCTEDICDPSQGCLHSNASLSCTDGNVCTTGDVCNGGVCVGGNTAAGCTACQAIATIPPDGGIFNGVTSGTGTLAGSCALSGVSPERVYQWTPTTSGTALISTCGNTTTYDTVLYVHSGGCQDGVETTCNDDTEGCGVNDGNVNSGRHGSSVTVLVNAGQTYDIVVDGYNGAAGAFTLTVLAPAVCGDGIRQGLEQCDGTDVGGCPSGACNALCRCVAPPGGLPDLVGQISQVSVEFGATVAAGDVAEGCAESTSGVDLLRFSVASRNQGTADLVIGDPACPSPCTAHPLEVCGNADFICSPAAGHNHAHYTGYARYELLDSSGQSIVVGHKQGFCLRDTSCANPVYTCEYQGISAGCEDVYNATLGCQYLDVTDVPSGSYTLRVTVDPFNRLSELDEANNVTTLPVVIPTRPGPTTSSTTTSTSTTSSSTTSTSTTSSSSTSPTAPPTTTSTTETTSTTQTTSTTSTSSSTATTSPVPTTTSTSTSSTSTSSSTSTTSSTTSTTETTSPVPTTTSTSTSSTTSSSTSSTSTSSTSVTSTSTTSTTSTTTATSTSSSSTVPVPTTTSSTVPPARATTTTTLPLCTAESCADDDPCTDDRCTPSGCVHDPREGFDALRCVVDAALAPPTCTDVPPSVQRQLGRARSLITRAASAPSAKSARLVKRAEGALNQAALAARRAAKRHRITPECADALRGALLARAERLQAAR